jgi:hypothetical protein
MFILLSAGYGWPTMDSNKTGSPQGTAPENCGSYPQKKNPAIDLGNDPQKIIIHFLTLPPLQRSDD